MFFANCRHCELETIVTIPLELDFLCRSKQSTREILDRIGDQFPPQTGKEWLRYHKALADGEIEPIKESSST